MSLVKVQMTYPVLTMVLCCLLLCGTSNAQHNPNHWPNRTGIVHLFEWKFSDVADECERFLAPTGFAAVQVSPVNENLIVTKRPWWERYQPMSYNIVTRSGNERQFRDMVFRCNKVGVRVYVDVIGNHMAAGDQGQAIGTGGATADVKARSYPAVPYIARDFHPKCAINNYNDKYEVRNCELVGLPDLNQTISTVRDRLLKFLNVLVDCGVAGFRFDAAKHMWPEDLKMQSIGKAELKQIVYSRMAIAVMLKSILHTGMDAIYSGIKSLNPSFYEKGSRAFIYQEVIDMGSEAVKKTEYNAMGAVTEFKFTAEIGRAFRGGNMLKWLKSWGPDWGMLPSNDSLVFVDNHDNQRSGSPDILTHKNPAQYIMATAFMLAHPYGIPRIMSSFYFDDKDQGPPADRHENIVSPIIRPDGQCENWVCEHRWPAIANMIRFRNVVMHDPLSDWWDNDGNQISFCRGRKGMIVLNNEQNELNRTLDTCLAPGTYCDVISGRKIGNRCSGKFVIVGEDGKGSFNVGVSECLALHIEEIL